MEGGIQMREFKIGDNVMVTTQDYPPLNLDDVGVITERYKPYIFSTFKVWVVMLPCGRSTNVNETNLKHATINNWRTLLNP